MSRTIATCALVILALAGPVSASYSGLLLIPTAETVGAGQYCVELQGDGRIGDSESETRVVNTEFGMGDRFEAGIDFDLSRDVEDGARTLLNAKYVLGISNRMALAAGVCNACRSFRPCPYAVTTCECGPCRLHLGTMKIEDAARWFTGADAALGSRLTLMADYTHGRENAASAGLEYQLSESTALMAGVLLPNDKSKSSFTLHLVIGGSYRR